MIKNKNIEDRLSGETLISAIHSISHKLMLLYSQVVFRQTGLNWQDWRILRAVVSLQSCRAQDICEECGLQRPHVSNGLARLEKAGHVSRQKNPENTRVKLVVSTLQGEQLVEHATPALNELNSRLSISEDEIDPKGMLRELRTYESELVRLVTEETAKPKA